MMKHRSLFYWPLLAIGVMLSLSAFRFSGPDSTQFIDFIQRFDLSPVWNEQEVITKTEADTVSRPQSIGTLGNNSQLIHIHFINVFKSPKNDYIYMVYGKMKTPTGIVDFNGKMDIVESRLYTESLQPQFKQGYIKGNFDFNIPNSKPWKGRMTGQFQTFFIWAANYQMHYDALKIHSEDFANNIFQGKWISADGKSIQPVSWRDVMELDPMNPQNHIRQSVNKWWE